MTHNQIAFAELKETIRHDTTVESETGRHNVVTESQGWANLAETQRHNIVGEKLGFDTLAETKRHNLVGEDQGWKKLDLEERRTIVAERGQSLNEWQSQFLPTDVESRRIQALAASSSASAALEQAHVNSALLPYNINYLETGSQLRNAQRIHEYASADQAKAQAALYGAQSTTENYKQRQLDAEARLKDANAEYREWLNQPANLFIEQGQGVTSIVGNLIGGGTRMGTYFND